MSGYKVKEGISGSNRGWVIDFDEGGWLQASSCLLITRITIIKNASKRDRQTQFRDSGLPNSKPLQGTLFIPIFNPVRTRARVNCLLIDPGCFLCVSSIARCIFQDGSSLLEKLRNISAGFIKVSAGFNMISAWFKMISARFNKIRQYSTGFDRIQQDSSRIIQSNSSSLYYPGWSHRLDNSRWIIQGVSSRAGLFERASQAGSKGTRRNNQDSEKRKATTSNWACTKWLGQATKQKHAYTYTYVRFFISWRNRTN